MSGQCFKVEASEILEVQYRLVDWTDSHRKSFRKTFVYTGGNEVTFCYESENCGQLRHPLD